MGDVADALPDHATVDEPYHLLEEDGYEFAESPSIADFEAQLDAVERIKPKAFTSHLAALPPERLKKFQALGMLVGGSATNIAEAMALE